MKTPFHRSIETLEKRVLFSTGNPFSVTTAATAARPSSAIEVANAAEISGYSYNPADPSASNSVQIVISGGPATPQTIVADLSSPELASSLGATNHDFDYSMPVLSVGAHAVSIYSITAANVKTLIATETITSQNSLFDEHYYLMENPDVAAAVAAGTFATGYDQYIEYGQFEGRSPSPYWNEARYLSQNPDVAAAVKAGTISSGFMHFYLYGQYENRQGLLYFNTNYYLLNNPDVAAAVTAHTVTSAFEQFVLYGQYEGRSATPLFSSSVYDANNQDILPYITGETFTSDYEQYVIYGQYEGRTATLVTPQQLEIDYTLIGDDADLDGAVNGTDFAILADNFNKNDADTSGWDDGDFNYDGSINGTDFAELAAKFNQSASSTQGN